MKTILEATQMKAAMLARTQDMAQEFVAAVEACYAKDLEIADLKKKVAQLEVQVKSLPTQHQTQLRAMEEKHKRQVADFEQTIARLEAHPEVRAAKLKKIREQMEALKRQEAAITVANDDNDNAAINDRHGD